MKKILLVALMVLLPMAAYALEPMEDGKLDEVTAQEGVRITIGGQDNADALVIYQQPVDVAWTNTDTSGNEYGIYQDVDAASGYDVVKIWGNLDIVAREASADEIGGTGGAAVVIGLPMVHKKIEEKKTDIYIAQKTGGIGTMATADTKLGSMYENGGNTYVNVHPDYPNTNLKGKIFISAIATP